MEPVEDEGGRGEHGQGKDEEDGRPALSGCGVYRHEVLQGNFISKEQAQALQPGMTRAQVRQIMGTPLITDMFRADRWDYVFTMRNRRGVEPQKFSVSVFFEGDALARVEGLDELPTNQDFVNLIGSKKKYTSRELQATPEQLSRALFPLRCAT